MTLHESRSTKSNIVKIEVIELNLVGHDFAGRGNAIAGISGLDNVSVRQSHCGRVSYPVSFRLIILLSYNVGRLGIILMNFHVVARPVGRMNF